MKGELTITDLSFRLVHEKAWLTSEPRKTPKVERKERRFDPRYTMPVLLFGWSGSTSRPGFHSLN